MLKLNKIKTMFKLKIMKNFIISSKFILQFINYTLKRN